MSFVRRSLLLLAAAACVAGCVAPTKKSSVFTPSPTPDQLQAIRVDFQSALPNARVGVVTAVLAEGEFALVREIDSSTAHLGTAVSFLDASQSVIANGRVVKIDADSLTVKYDAGRRAVQVGDAAVTFQ
ncbi:MAG: hypothetical protein QM754_17815 [Tepidisphaeraceae bacterium]